MFLVGVSAFSCRTEEFHNEEEAHGNTQFHLTSKRISLNESKHKTKLLPELQKAELGIEAFAQKNAKGKIVNYGNGVSIDTDDVVYIEYGPYHTYTFKINRDNAPVDAPVENLILSLEPDGSYKELLKTYHLTQSDWHALSLGNGIDLTGKTTTVEVAKGTYHQALAKGGGSGCYYESQQVYQACCHGEHGEGNIDEWYKCICTGSGLPKMYTIEILVCPPEPGAPTAGWIPTPSPPTAPTGGGSTEGGSTGSETNPTNPTDPNTVEGAQGQLGGTPTLPILEINRKKTPCEKTKALLADPVVQTKIDSLEAQSKLGGEKAFLYKNDNTTSALIAGGEHHVKLSQYTDYKGIYHNHTPLGTKMLSVNDIVTLYKNIVYDQTPATAKDTFVGMVAHETCNCPPDNFVYHNYLLRFNGDLSTAGAIATMSAEKIKEAETLYDNLIMELLAIPSLRNGPGVSASLNAQGLERLFFGTLAKMNIAANQISLQKIEKDGTINTIQLNPDGTTTPVPCP